MDEYRQELTRRLRTQLGDRLVAAWVVGSSALGDFDATTALTARADPSAAGPTPEEVASILVRVGRHLEGDGSSSPP